MARPPRTQSSFLCRRGGGVNNFDKGIQMSLAVQRKRVNEYMHRLTVAGLGDRRDRMYPMLRQYLDPPKNQALSYRDRTGSRTQI